MRTNFDKLTGWDADYYKSLTNEDCIVCLTERQIYVLGQTLEQITWHRTRWTGDKSGLDFDEISSEIQYKLAERMTCETLTLLAEQVANLTQLVQDLQDTINQGNITINSETVISDVFSPTELARPLGGDNQCDNDIIWGGIVELVDYIHNQNTQFFGEIEQNIGNSAAVLSDAISAIPIIGLLPVDEALSFAANMAENIGQEYATITDEDFLNTVKCDLFCLVSGDSPCDITIDILLDWVSSHNAFTIDTVTTRIIDIASFIANGTFLSNDAFWAATMWQMYIAGMDENFLVSAGVASYEAQLASGYNSPDADWAILCDVCPEYPMLINVRCQDALQLGTISQIDENHWNLVSQLHIGAHYCFIQDDSLLTSATFKILDITIITSTGLNNGSQYSDPCVDTQVFSWIPGQIGALNRFGYMFSSDQPFEIEIEVSQIGA